MPQYLTPLGTAIVATLALLAGCANAPVDVPREPASELAEMAPAKRQLTDKNQSNGPTGKILTVDDAIAFERIGTLREPHAISIKGKTSDGEIITPPIESIHKIDAGPGYGRLVFKDPGQPSIEIVSISLDTPAEGAEPIGEQLPVVVRNAETREPYTKLIAWASIEQIVFDPIDEWLGLPATRIKTDLNPSATWRQEARSRLLSRQAEQAIKDASKRGLLKRLPRDGSLPDSLMRQLAAMLTADSESPDCQVQIESGVADLVAHINNHLKCLQAREEITRLRQGLGISSKHTPLTTIYLMGIIRSPLSE